MLSGPALSDHVGGLIGREAVFSFLRQANGFFSVVCWDGRHGWMAVDRVRGLPLFYGHKDGSLFVSDDAYQVLEYTGDRSVDGEARKEFLWLRSVTGRDTLFRSVKQVQAGEVVFLERDGRGDISSTQEDYYIYRHEPSFEGDEDELAETMDRALESSFRRLTEYAAGRPIVVPLSGGYDSRLTVTMLKRLGYPDVRTFTYGSPGNKESKWSRFVAEALDLPWHFVPYGPGDWHRWYRSPEMKGYMEYASGASWLPIIQDLPALLDLTRRSVFPEGSVFAPGHTVVVDRITDNLDEFWEKRGIRGEVAFCSLIRDLYFAVRKDVPLEISARGIRPLVERYAPKTKEDWVCLADTWVWRECQAKNLIAWNQLYTFLGHTWWLPLWDSEYASTYAAAPLSLVADRTFYVSYVRRRFAQAAGLPLGRTPFNATDAQHRRKRIKDAAKRFVSPRAMRRITGLFGRWVKRDPFEMAGLFSKEERALLGSGYSDLGLRALDFLQSLEERLGAERMPARERVQED